jgi:hypothetical protein
MSQYGGLGFIAATRGQSRGPLVWHNSHPWICRIGARRVWLIGTAPESSYSPKRGQSRLATQYRQPVTDMEMLNRLILEVSLLLAACGSGKS